MISKAELEVVELAGEAETAGSKLKGALLEGGHGWC